MIRKFWIEWWISMGFPRSTETGGTMWSAHLGLLPVCDLSVHRWNDMQGNPEPVGGRIHLKWLCFNMEIIYEPLELL